MKNHTLTCFLLALLLGLCQQTVSAQERRPIDNQHPLWFIHVDVWYKADPQKIIDLVPEDVRPYVCMNLSLSCQYDKEKDVYKMPQNAIRTYKSWATVCQANGVWFTCQPASGGHTHIQDDDLETFEYFYKRYPNFLGWNYAEQFWGFDEPGDKSSSTQASRIALFAKLVPMAHKYGGFLTVSFCGNIWSHPLNPMGMMKRNNDLFQACKAYPDAILWLYKYTTSSCFYNNESVTYGPFVSGLAKNYGVRYDNCGWNGALDGIYGENHGMKYPAAAGIGTVMEQSCANGGAVWDGPELTWREECFHEVWSSTVDGYTRRNWEQFNNFKGVWLDMFRKILDGTMYIPTREEVVGKTKIVVINDVNSGNDEQKYAAWGNLYDGVYKQDDPFNRGNGQWMDNFCYFKKTGRYGAIPLVMGLYDEAARSIPVQVKKSNYMSRWGTITSKTADFNAQYPEVSTGDLFVSRFKNQLVTYTPYTYMNKKKTAEAVIPLQYNSCETLQLTYGKLSSGLIREYADHIDFYLNNYRNDTTAMQLDKITLTGATEKPTYTLKKHSLATASLTESYDADAKTYTLNVQHNGALDISIKCSGSRTGLLQDGLGEIAALPLPKQPADYNGEIIIEAEDMDYKSIKSCVTDPYGAYPSVRGHAGNGFIDMGVNKAGSLRHQLNVKHPGDYTIAIRYTSPQRSGTLKATVNGQAQTLKVEKTATNEWRKVVFDATLKEGRNNFIITNSNGVSMYIDQIIYTPAGTPAEKFLVTVRDAEHGKVMASVDEAAEGDKVTLTVIPDEGYRLADLAILHGGVTIDADHTFTMPDDNVTIQPVFADATAVYALDFSNVGNGGIPEGWRVVQEDNGIHEYPNTFGQGSRTFVGFTGTYGKGLYWRINMAEYGRQSAYKLTLNPGSYKLTYVMAAWKGAPKYKASILKLSDNTVVKQSTVYTAAPNAEIGGSASTNANLSSASVLEMPFSITERGDYVIRFAAAESGYTEFLLLACRINSDGTNSISSATAAHSLPMGIYSPTGVRRQSLQHGLNIVVTADGQSRKVFIK